MSDQLLEIGLFGYPQVRLDGVVVDNFVTKRAEALFYYLVVTRRAHSRDVLATLFWPDMLEAQGKKNLRTALPVLRKLFGDYLLISRDAVAFNDDLPFMLDTEALATAVTTYQPSGDSEGLETAVAGYKGTFLEGFHIDSVPEFDNWVFAQAEYWRGVLVQGMHLLAVHYLQQHQYIKGLHITTRLLEEEPWSESAYRQQMLLFAYNQQRSAALKTYEQCQQALKEAFDMDPMVETVALYQRIRAEETNGDETATPLHNLPRELTPFVGRSDELRQIREKALNPRYPLLTIIGEGGVGKSRVALTAVAQLLYDFPDGTWFVPLISVSASNVEEDTETALALAIVQALQISLSDSDPITEQVIDYLQGKKLLLALDNMEHLVNGTGFILQILREAKQVQLIVTSRRRLNVQVESVFRLQGLPTPDATIAQTKTDGVAYALAHTSMQLFVERAGRVRPEFALTAQNVEAVSQICRLVAGLPLGIELAAALVEQQQCAEIAVQIEQNANQLATDMRDLSPHHRSVWALFDYSWQLLTAHEREVLAQCSVFAGGFMLDAAMAVSQATEAELTNLVHQSLLARDENGRFHFHPLLHQFSKEKWEAMGDSGETPIIARHYTHYLGWLHANQDTLMALPRHELEVEFSNVALAWQSATAADDFMYLAAVMEGWISYTLALTFKRESLQLIIDTLKKFEQTAVSSPQTDEMRGWLLAGYSFAQYGVTNYQEMSAAADKLISLAPTPTLLVYGRYLKGAWARSAEQEIEKGVEHLRYAAKHADLLVLPAHLGVLSELSIMLSWQGEHDESMQQINLALTIAREYKLTYVVIVLLLNIGIFYQEQKKYYQAIPYYEEIDALTRIEADAPNAVTLFDRWALAYVELGQYEKAERYFERSHSLWDKWLPWTGRVASLEIRAHAYVRMEQYQKALHCAEVTLNFIAENHPEPSPLLVIPQIICGQAQLGLKQWEAAGKTFTLAFEEAERAGSSGRIVNVLAGLAAVGVAQNDLAATRKWGNQLAETLPSISTYRDLVEDWAWIYLTCYEALTAVADPRAAQVLQTAYNYLQELAALIEDTAVRQQFLQNVPDNREIMKIMEGTKQK